MKSIPTLLPGVRTGWIFDGLADLELTALSCLLRAPAGGEAVAILSRCRNFTTPVLVALLEGIRRKDDRRRNLGISSWIEVRDSFDSDWHWQIRCYAQGRRVTFTERDAAAHAFLRRLAYPDASTAVEGAQFAHAA